MRRRVMVCLGLVCSAAALVTLTTQESALQGNSVTTETKPAPVPVPRKVAAPPPTNIVRARAVPDTTMEEPVWLFEARNNPDPTVRIHALELLANDPGQTLNSFTYALVDPDESVRARAQELFEDALTRQ